MAAYISLRMRPFNFTSSNVRAVIFDISGTVLDFGCLGPLAAFVELFARHGVTLSVEEARRPMGTHKRDHIWTLLNERSIGERWKAAQGTAPNIDVLNRLCAEFAPLQAKVVLEHCNLIPGVLEVVSELRRREIRIVNTTGFESGMIKNLIPRVAEAGYSADLWVCPDQVGEGRPAPWMIFHAAQKLGIYPPSAICKSRLTHPPTLPKDMRRARGWWRWSDPGMKSAFRKPN